MPELPEVKVMQKIADKYFSNSILYNIDILYSKYIKKVPNNYIKLKKILPIKINNIFSKGKFIWFELENNWSIWIIPAMTGYLQPNKGKYTKIIFNTSKKNIYFNDMRNFGQIHFCDDKNKLINKLKELGPDVLEEKVESNYLINKLKKLKQTQLIGDVLLNQKVLAGVGNYIRADALYLSKISPFRQLKDLTDKDIELLLHNIKKIINKSYKCQINYALQKYDYKKQTECYEFYVYSRKITDKGEKVDNKKMKNDRTIWWVPDIQI